MSNKITAVLSFDALSPEAAEALKSEYDKFEARQNPQLLERAQWISLYF